jgi:hypothetical protein
MELNYKILISNSYFTAKQQQGEQMKVCAREGFAYQSVKLILLAVSNRYEVNYNTLFKW